jgi:DNA repair protein RecO (recombination protein O)
MQIKSLGIILNNVKLGDKKVISKIYTQHSGLQSFAIHFGTSSKSRIKPAHIQPLNLVELEIVSKEKNEVNRVNEIRIGKPYIEIHNNILKSCIAGFINELLIKTLKESEANEDLFRFIYSKFLELDENKGNLGGWPLHFMMGLTQYLGIMPNNNFSNDNVFFNMMDGRFEVVPPLHMNYLDRNDSSMFHKLINEYENFLLLPPKNEERSIMLNLLIQYYRFHIPGFSDFKSLPVLQATLYS